MNTIYFIRHGATPGNLEKRYIGRTDQPLSEAGRVQLQTLRASAPQTDRLFVSPMLRTRQTAEILFPGMEAVPVSGLREIDFGLFEGRSHEELADDPAYCAWVDSGRQGSVPGGEPMDAFKARCKAAFEQAAGQLPEGASAAFVVHGCVIMAVLDCCTGPGQEFNDSYIENGECLECRYQDGTLQICGKL